MCGLFQEVLHSSKPLQNTRDIYKDRHLSRAKSREGPHTQVSVGLASLLPPSSIFGAGLSSGPKFRLILLTQCLSSVGVG